MNEWKTMSDRLMKRIKQLPKKAWVAIGFVAILLLAVSEWIPPRAEETSASTNWDGQAYVQQLEQQLTDIVEHIEGAGKCRVMVTLENGVEYVYANERSETSNRTEDLSDTSEKTTVRDDNESKYVIVNSSDGKQGLLVTEIQPTVRGVVVVCEGGEDEKVRERIMKTVATVLNVTSSRVCITKLS